MVPHTPCFPRAELPQRRSRWPHYGRRRGMPLWAIEAIAVSEDSRWQDFPIWAEVVVRAPTPAQARLVAAAMEGGQIADQIGRDTSELQSLMRISYAVFCFKKKTNEIQYLKMYHIILIQV